MYQVTFEVNLSGIVELSSADITNKDQPRQMGITIDDMRLSSERIEAICTHLAAHP